ncbi:MAG: alpha/beta hydrolase [Spirochaetes bacterium]|nr:alpha/beta hydrolase [Spirochaetota bacterium]
MNSRLSSSLADCTNNIIKQINEHSFEKLVLIGHSIGGLLAALVAQQLRQKVEHVIYIASNLPKDNTNAIDSFPFLQKLMLNSFVKSQVKKDKVHIGTEAKYFISYFCNTSSLNITEYVKSQHLIAEPICIFNEKINWDYSIDIPQTYIRLLKDKTINKNLQTKMAKNLNITNIIDIESDHLVMLSNPNLLYNKIKEIINE